MDENKILDGMKGLIAEERSYNEAALKTHSDQLRGDQKEHLEKIAADIEVLETRYNDIIVKMNRPVSSAVMSGIETPEHKERMELFNSYLRGKVDKHEYKAKFETRALDGTSDANGGFLVPDDYQNKIISKAYELATVRPYANVMTTSLNRVKVSSASQITASFGPIHSPANAVSITTGMINIDVNKISGSITISRDLINDAEADIVGYIANNIPRKIAEVEDEAFCVGTGAAEPYGIFTNTTVQANVINSGVAAAISDVSNNGVDALIDMTATPKSTYLANACWMMNRSTMSEVRQLKDSTGQYYIYQMPLVAGDMPMLLGYKCLLTEFAPDIAANAYPIVFGNLFDGYNIFDNKGLEIIRNDYIGGNTDDVVFYFYKRTGANVVLPEAFSIMKIST